MDSHQIPLLPVAKPPRPFRQRRWRWLALFFMSFYEFGTYYCFDNPQALQTQLQGPPLNLSNAQYNSFYSIYQLPSILLSFFGGVLIDIIGVRISIFFFGISLLLGQSLFTFGAYKVSYAIMLAGRVLYGVAGENQAITQSTITAKWFKGKELAFAIGITLAVCRAGDIVNSLVTPRLAELFGNSWFPCLVGLYISVFVFLLAIPLVWMDYQDDTFEAKVKQRSSQVQDHPAETQRENFWTSLKKLSWPYWLLVFNSLLAYTSIGCFLASANDIFHQTFAMTNSAAGNFVSIIYTLSAFSSPFFGLIIDKYGKRVTWINISTIFLIISHALMTFLPNYSEFSWIVLVPVTSFGIGYSIYSSVFWCCVPLLVKEEIIGSAYGLATALQNGVGAIALIGLGAIQDTTKEEKSGYYYSEMLLLVASVVTLILGFLLKYFDSKHSDILETPSSAMKSHASSLLSEKASFKRSF